MFTSIFVIPYELVPIQREYSAVLLILLKFSPKRSKLFREKEEGEVAQTSSSDEIGAQPIWTLVNPITPVDRED